MDDLINYIFLAMNCLSFLKINNLIISTLKPSYSCCKIPFSIKSLISLNEESVDHLVIFVHFDVLSFPSKSFNNLLRMNRCLSLIGVVSCIFQKVALFRIFRIDCSVSNNAFLNIVKTILSFPLHPTLCKDNNAKQINTLLLLIYESFVKLSALLSLLLG